MSYEPIFLATALLFVGTGMWLVCFFAPNMPMGSNSCRRFILIAPLRYKDHWGDGDEKNDEHIPWWFKGIAYCVIISCEVWPALGWVVLAGIALFIMWEFIQKITESGRYARPESSNTEFASSK